MLTRPHDHADAASIAAAAGRLLVDLRLRRMAQGVDSADLRREGDRRSNEFIIDAITRRHPGDAILSEEAVDDLSRLDSPRVWIVDPLDGTREFGEAGRVDWAVHVALVVDQAPRVGAVALPARGLTLGTDGAPAAPARRHLLPRVLVSRTRPPSFIRPFAKALGATVIPLGSAGAKAMAVVLGEGEIFVHAGGQYEWDSAAPVAVALAAGLHASRIDGTSLRYNSVDPWMPDLLICVPEFATRALEALGQLSGSQRDAASS